MGCRSVRRMCLAARKGPGCSGVGGDEGGYCSAGGRVAVGQRARRGLVLSAGAFRDLYKWI